MFKKQKKGKNNIKAKKAIILFFLFIFIIIFIIAIHTSKVGIEIEKFDLDTERTKGNKISHNSKIYLLILRRIFTWITSLSHWKCWAIIFLIFTNRNAGKAQ